MNLRFVVSVAKQYQNLGLTLGDLINEGNMGLIDAARRYDETKGFKFISYAVWWIRQAIHAAIAEQTRLVHIPYNQLTLLSKLRKSASKLEQLHGRKASLEELAESLEISVEKVIELTSKTTGYLSIDAPIGTDEHNLLDILPNGDYLADDELLRASVSEELKNYLGILCQRDRDLLVLYYGLGLNCPLTLEEIARRFGITKEHVGRLKETALTRLRKSSYAPVLRSILS